MKNYLNRKRKGYSTAEWVISAPYLLLLCTLLGFIVAFMVSVINFSSMATYIASDMNLRQTGFKQVQNIDISDKSSDLKAGVRNLANNSMTYSLTMKDLTVSTGSDTGNTNVKKALVRSINENREMIAFPFTKVTNVNCTVTRNTTDANGKSITNNGKDASTSGSLNISGSSNDFSGSLVQVTITYKFSPVKVFGKDLINVDALTRQCTGYAVIT